VTVSGQRHEIQVGVYLPQIGYDYGQLLERARWADELGFDAVWLFDHLAFEGMPVPVLEGWTLATALLTQTQRIAIGHLVLCANFRHPVVLGKMATTLAAIAPDRFLLGLGSGSTQYEHDVAGLPFGTPGERTTRLDETVRIVQAMLRGESLDFDGSIFRVSDFPNLPVPASPPPLVIGGSGPRTLGIVARHADWWNLPTYAWKDFEAVFTRFERACEKAGRDPESMRLTSQSVLVLVEREDEIPAALEQARRRYGGAAWGLQEAGHIGTPEMVLPRLEAAIARGVSHFIFFLHDRATRHTLELLAHEVVARLR